MIVLLFCAFAALADTQDTFHALFEREVGASLADLHFKADAAVARALEAQSIAEAMRAQSEGRLSSLASTPFAPVTAPAIPRLARPLTIVLVPGVFAEFIANRAFEEVLEKPSPERERYVEKVRVSGASDYVTHVKDWTPGGPEVRLPRRLDEVVPMGEVRVGDNVVRVILFATEFGTLESLGDARDRAATFNRRLEKYLDVTGDQDLAFVGYSRGAILGLEMLAQAREAGRPWIGRVRGMISLSGVTGGSALADDALVNAASPGYRILNRLRQTNASLELVDTSRPYMEWYRTWARNNERWTEFFRLGAVDFKQMNAGNPTDLGQLLQVDPRSPVVIVARIWMELGLVNWFFGYNANIERFRFATEELFKAITELGSEARTVWWQKRTLPVGPRYYALGAAMADPLEPDPEPRLFKNRAAYGNGSYDDVGLLQNHRDYTRLSGVALNDSQVSVAQAAFLPNAIAAANPANTGLRTRFLGIAGTHHWGLALRQVNKMWGGQTNGYPREALLRALAAQVIVDAD